MTAKVLQELNVQLIKAKINSYFKDKKRGEIIVDPMEKLNIEMAQKSVYENEELFIKSYQVTAKLLFRYYQALMDAGFSPVQALDIVICHGVSPGGMNQ